MAVEDRDAQVRLERCFRVVAAPLVNAWRGAVRPVPGASAAGQDDRATRIEEEVRRLGPPAWPLLHRLTLCAPVKVAREARRLIAAAAADVAVPADPGAFDRVRYFLAPGLVVRDGEGERALLAAHVRATIADFAQGSNAVKGRAEEELCLLGAPAETALAQTDAGAVAGLTAPELERLRRAVRWRRWPDLQGRVGLSMEGWDAMPWREKVSLVSLWRRVAGDDAIPVLDRIRHLAADEIVRERAVVELLTLDAVEGLPLPDPRPPQTFQILIILARQLRERGEVDKALEFLWQVVERLPADREARYQLAFTLHVAKRYEEAITQFRAALGLGGNDQSFAMLAHYNLACACAMAGRHEEAFAALLEAVKLGYRDLEHMEKEDQDLEGLRRLPGFQEVLRALREARAEDAMRGKKD
jgi:tetratricopeptide (TPR) repeat protein